MAWTNIPYDSYNGEENKSSSSSSSSVGLPEGDFDILSQAELVFQDVDAVLNDTDESMLQVQPTPISSIGRLQVVSSLSVQDDANLCNSNIARLCISALLSADRNSASSALAGNTADTRITYLESNGQPTAGQQTTAGEEGPRTNPRIRNNGGTFCKKWDLRYKELLQFKTVYGHCSVPNVFPPNPRLAQWVKRQRYQHKLKMEGKHSSLTDERLQTLEEAGFVWDSHEASWMERWSELKEFRQNYGHSNVPSNYPENRQLSIWVKCQRRQHKLLVQGSKSNMSTDRIRMLESLDFVFNPRNLV